MKLLFVLALSGFAAAQAQTPPPSSGGGSTGTPSNPGSGAGSTSSITTGSPGGFRPTTGTHPGGIPTNPAQPVWLDLALTGRILLGGAPPQSPSAQSPSAASGLTTPRSPSAASGLTPPYEPVAVMLSCVGPRPFTEPNADRAALTDNRGRFALVLGLNNTPGTPNTRGGGGLPRLQGCEVSIRLPGYAPFRKDLGRLTSLSDFDLGDIRLKRLANGGAGTTISATSASAPEKARREYRAAIEDAYARRNDQALAHLRAAVDLHPSYAAAHYLTGYLHDRMAHRDLARQSYEKSAAADPLYVNPILQLAQMAAEDLDNPTAARLAARVIELIPAAYAEIYVIAAGAQFNTGDLPAAESTARAAIAARLDASAPRLHLLLAEVLWKQKKYEEARREYLTFADAIREGPEADLARTRATEK